MRSSKVASLNIFGDSQPWGSITGRSLTPKRRVAHVIEMTMDQRFITRCHACSAPTARLP